MAKGYVRENLSPCVVLVFLVPKKDGSWRMCIDCRIINNITVKYHHPIPTLDNPLDELHGSCLFSRFEKWLSSNSNDRRRLMEKCLQNYIWTV